VNRAGSIWARRFIPSAASMRRPEGHPLQKSLPLRRAWSRGMEDRIYKLFFREVEIGELDTEALRFRPVQILR